MNCISCLMVYQKSCEEEEKDGKNWQMQNVLVFKQTQST